MTDHEVLEVYRSLVPFLAQLCGPCCEVVLHDVSNPSCSVIAIENGFNSGRQIGSPLTDLAHAIIESGEYKDKDYLANYSGVSKKKNFVSSTYFIKNEGRLIAVSYTHLDVYKRQVHSFYYVFPAGVEVLLQIPYLENVFTARIHGTAPPIRLFSAFC